MPFPRASKRFVYQSQLGHLSAGTCLFAVISSDRQWLLDNPVAWRRCWFLYGAAFGLMLACVLPDSRGIGYKDSMTPFPCDLVPQLSV